MNTYVLIAIAALGITTIAGMTYSAQEYTTLGAQTAEKQEILNMKGSEAVEAYIENGKLLIQNNGANPVKVAEVQLTDDKTNSNTFLRKSFQGSGTEIIDNGIKYQFVNQENAIHIGSPLELQSSDLDNNSLGDKYGFIITSLGNKIPIINKDVQEAEIASIAQANSGSTPPDPNDPTYIAQSMIDGMGLQSRIIQNENDGRITHGNGMTGQDDSIKPYLPVASNTDFAATVLEDDNKETHYIPAFWKSYQYTGSSLTDNTPAIPNILGYSTTKTMSGSPSISITPDGILASGSGEIIVKLQDITPNSILRGTLTNADVKFVNSPLDLTTLTKSGANYQLYDGNSQWAVQASKSHNQATSCGSGCIYYIYHTFVTYRSSFPGMTIAEGSDLTVTRTSNFVNHCTGYYQGCNTVVYAHDSYSHGDASDRQNLVGMRTETLSSATNPVSTGIVSLTGQTVYSSVGVTGTPPTITPITYKITSTHPWNEQFDFTNNFEQSATLPTNSYLVITLNGGSALIKAESGSNNQGFINIDGLNANIPYQITKDSVAIATGMTSSTGQITFDITGNVPSLTGGFLNIYPDSLAYRGSFSTVVFDNLNGETIHIPTVEDKTYVVHAYANIPVTGTITITNLNLDGTLSIPYLDGNYVSGDAIQVPVIPTYSTINLTINGVPTILNYADILGGTGIKIADPASGTITKEDLTNSIHSITTSAGTPTFVVATSDGTINAIMSLTISGTATLSNSYTLSQIPPPPPAPTRKDPLEGFVEIYNNGVLIQTQTLGINPNPAFVPTNTLSSSTATQSVTYTYGDYNLSGATSVSVSTGDFVEFYLFGKITGDIENYTPPSGMQIDTESGTASATVDIRDAHIQTSS